MNYTVAMEIDKIKTWLGTGSINIFGRPFAGKDTVCGKLADLFGGVVLGGGDILRNSEITPYAKEVMEAGGLFPTADYVKIVLPYLSRNEFKDKSLILSSVGRWIGEEKGVIQAASESGHSLKLCIYLDITDKVAHDRLKIAQIQEHRNRTDDSPEKLELRFQEFFNKTLPVLAEYEKLNLLEKIDGTQSPDRVVDSIIKALSSRT